METDSNRVGVTGLQDWVFGISAFPGHTEKKVKVQPQKHNI